MWFLLNVLEWVLRVVVCVILLFIYLKTVEDQQPRLGKRELIFLLLFTCNYVVSVWRGFFFLRVLGMGYVILLWHSLSLPCNYSGLCGLNVVTYSIKYLLCFVSLVFNKSDLFNALIFLMLSSMSDGGYLCINR